MTNPMNAPWIHISEYGKEAKEYIHKRKTGELKSLLTPWTKLNVELLNGLEWNSVIQLAGGSGTGKTAIKDQLTRGLIDLNLDQDFAVLDFQFEMLGRTSVMRDLSRHTGKNLKHLSSAFAPISDEEERLINHYIDNELGQYEIYTVDAPKSVPVIEALAKQFYETMGKPIIATLDHSLLVGRHTEKDDWEVIRRLADMLIRTKKQIPIIWIILNQFNREFEKTERQVPNSLVAFPTKKDIYGGDIIYFASDAVIAIARPDQYLPPGTYYGPRGLNQKVTEDLMVWHLLKNRVGEPNINLTMKSDFAAMRILEAPEP